MTRTNGYLILDCFFPSKPGTGSSLIMKYSIEPELAVINRIKYPPNTGPNSLYNTLQSTFPKPKFKYMNIVWQCQNGYSN